MKIQLHRDPSGKDRLFAQKGILTASSAYCLGLAWLVAALALQLASKLTFLNKDYTSGVSVLLMAALVLLLWLFFRTLESKTLLSLIMVAALALYCSRTIIQKSDIFYTFGCCSVTGIVLWFSSFSFQKERVSPLALRLASAAMIVAFTAWVGGTCAAMYANYGTPTYDFGIFAQMFYYMRKTGLPLTTCERDGLLSHFAVHLSPVFYLLLPLYWVFPSPATLEFGQCLVVALGILPLVGLCRHYRLTNGQALLFAGIYLSYPAFVSGCFFHIHENNFLAPLILWMLLAFEKDSWPGMVVSTLLVLSVKEDAAVYGAIIILYFLVRRLAEKKPAPGQVLQETLKDGRFWLLLAVLAYFLLAVHYLSTSGDGAMTGRYGNYIYDRSGSLATMVKAVFQNPMYVLAQCFTNEKLYSTLLVLLPTGFLALALTGWEQLLLFVPYVLLNLMSDYYYQHVLGYQYYFGSGVLLLYLAAANSPRLKRELRSKILLFALLSSCFLTLSLNHSRLLSYLPAFWHDSQMRDSMREVLRVIPEDASVVSSTFLLPELSEREEVYDIDYTSRICDYVALDIRYASGEEALTAYEADPAYELVKKKEKAAAVFRYVGGKE